MSENNSSSFPHVFGWGVAGIIVLAIIGGLMMTGSPMKARDLKIDAKRLNNMQDIARVISCYADNNDGVLPGRLDEIKRSIDGGLRNDPKLRRCQNLKWKKDPISDVDCEYNPLGEKSFELCGVFERKQDPRLAQNKPIYGSNNRAVLNTTPLRTRAGRFCYTAKDWR